VSRALVALGVVLLCAGCAQVGPVQPPSQHLPPPITDLAAARRGPGIELAFTPSPGAAAYQVCFWPGAVTPTPPPAPAPDAASAALPRPGAVVAAVPYDVPPPPLAPPDPRAAMPVPGGATLPPCPHLVPLTGHTLSTPAGSGALSLALAATNAQGLTAGWSNLVVVPLGGVAPPPSLESVVATPQGVRLQWQSPQPPPDSIEIFRQAANRAPLLLANPAPDAGFYLDTTAAPGAQFTYWLRSARRVAAGLIESADSAHRAVDTRDVFPPPVPQGLQAVAAPDGGVDLSWNAVNALDLAGYNLYRRIPAGAWRRLNASLLPTPVFHDPAPPSGAEYAVTSVDNRGNESMRSRPVISLRRARIGQLIFFQDRPAAELMFRFFIPGHQHRNFAQCIACQCDDLVMAWRGAVPLQSGQRQRQSVEPFPNFTCVQVPHDHWMPTHPWA
jgi:hypothetical protein